MKLLNPVTLALVFLLAGCGDSAPGKGERAPEKSKEKATETPVAIERKKNVKQATISDLKQIGYALMLYASDNREKFPESLKELVTQSYLNSCDCYISEYDKISVKGSADDFDPVKNCSYAYLATGIIAGNYGSDVPIVFEKPWCLPENSDSIAVLYADGSSRFIPISKVNKKSCLEVAKILFEQVPYGSAKEIIFKNAKTADLLR